MSQYLVYPKFAAAIKLTLEQPLCNESIISTAWIKKKEILFGNNQNNIVIVFVVVEHDHKM